MKVIELKPEESETLERAFYEADSYERLISVLGRQLNTEASTDAMYRMKKITAAGVWEKVDEGELTKAQALRICGPRPKES